jgi:hypothetical protein
LLLPAAIQRSTTNPKGKGIAEGEQEEQREQLEVVRRRKNRANPRILIHSPAVGSAGAALGSASELALATGRSGDDETARDSCLLK